ncbi:hypothetical protein BC629DRAFT_1616082, partial [Irpex lacteus]
MLPQPQYTASQRSHSRSRPPPEDSPYDPPSPDGDDFYTGSPQDVRLSTAADQSTRAPSPPPGPILDHSHLRPSKQAALLFHKRTLELYRANAQKTQDPDVQFESAVFMVDASKTMPIPAPIPGNVMDVERTLKTRDDLVLEATPLLKRNADRGHMPSQYFLADCYANTQIQTRLRPSLPSLPAAALHPEARYRLGIAELNGGLGLSKSPKEGVKWLKRSAPESATAEFPHALHELALLHERRIDNVLFVEYEYAGGLGYVPSAYRLGECYEYGKMGCPQNPALSIHFYNIAAQENYRDACFISPPGTSSLRPVCFPSPIQRRFCEGKRAADAGLVKAMYAVGYFLEVGIRTGVDLDLALQYYKRAAELGDKRAAPRLRSKAPVSAGPGSVLNWDDSLSESGSGGEGGKGGKDKDCVVM